LERERLQVLFINDKKTGDDIEVGPPQCHQSASQGSFIRHGAHHVLKVVYKIDGPPKQAHHQAERPSFIRKRMVGFSRVSNIGTSVNAGTRCWYRGWTEG